MYCGKVGSAVKFFEEFKILLYKNVQKHSYPFDPSDKILAKSDADTASCKVVSSCSTAENTSSDRLRPRK